ncbi:hypothetical protein FQN54_003456 [Arachnomyces sp. PD_36]|nr:hypothetical protein FQN54_003456 [Arachnomyces sp. PD_36]
MPIAALPENTIRAIGATSALSDPCSVIKELIDNSLDASATSISVEISSNTLDAIQVKDNGHGIQPDDREFVCRPSFTSKIQTLEDLRDVGGKSLGFRGVALAGIAEMSGGVMVTTRVEGEVVATVLKYGRTGELDSKEKSSHPRGTTVRVSNFLDHVPVRKQTALKASSKTLAKTKKMLQTYAIARPTVRLSLKVLKSKNETGNWIYAPATKSTPSDAVSKVSGPDVVSQCIVRSWPNDDDVENRPELISAMTDDGSSSGYSLVACLPRPTAVSRTGQYIAIDGRPVSALKGVPKDIIKSYKSHLRSLWSREGLEMTFSDMFLCLHISCPSGSYDVNVEPSKDDVIFENSSTVLSLAEGLFSDVYGEISLDGSSENRGAKTQTEYLRQDNAFDILLARAPSTAERPPERRRSQPMTHGGASHGASTPRLHNNSTFDTAETPQEDHGGWATPWTLAKRTVVMGSPDDTQPILTPSRQQQLLTPARERSSPQRNIPIRGTARPPRPSLSRPQQFGVNPPSPDTTPLLTRGMSSRDFQGPAALDLENRTPEPPKRGYGGKEITTWIQDSGVHVDDTQSYREAASDDGEVTPRPARSEPDPDHVTIPDKNPDKPMTTGPSRKPFKLPLNPAQKLWQASSLADGSESTPRPTSPNGEHSETNDELNLPEYPGFERVSTLIRDPSKPEFTNTQFDDTLDYERRKRALNQPTRNRPRPQSALNFLSTDPSQDSVLFFPKESSANKSPHKNRYLAAKSSLAANEKGVQGQGGGKPQSHPCGLDHDDPRAYYIRNRDKMQESTDKKTGLKIRRTQTYKLPLETIPDDSKIHHLLTTCHMGNETVPSLLHQTQRLDTYVQSGAISSSGCGFINPSQRDYADWEVELCNLLQQRYRTEDGDLPVDVPLDFKLPDGETYGFV